MFKKRYLGLYFGEDALSLVETEGVKILQQGYLPYTAEEFVSTSTNEETLKIALIQKALRDKGIKIRETTLSLGAKETLIRSFLTPSSKEKLDLAVISEVKRYIPFKLEDLIYDFRIQKIIDKKTKKVNVLFAGVKKEIIENYRSILTQCSLKPITIEPAIFGILRILKFKKFLQRDKTTLVIVANSQGAEILIAKDTFVQFYRDIRFLPISRPQVSLEEKLKEHSLKLVNEVKISLDYYSRNYSEERIYKIILLVEKEIENHICKHISEEMNIPILTPDFSNFIKTEERIKLDVLKALSSTFPKRKLAISFNLFQKKELPLEVKIKKGIKEQRVARPLISLSPALIKIILRDLLIAVGLIFLLFIYFSKNIQGLNRELQEIQMVSLDFLKDFKTGVSLGELNQLKSEYKDKVSQLMSLFERRIYLTSILNSIPKSLPSGIWLKGLFFKIEEGLPFLKIEGNCYLEDEKERISSIDDFVSNLKKSQISLYFPKIVLEEIKKDKIKEIPVAVFKITCR